MVCSDIPYVPFEYVGPEGPTGFDVDLVTELGSRMNREVEIVPRPLDSFRSAFADGTCDIAASALVISGPEAASWTYSSPYLEVGQSLLVRAVDAPALPSFASLSGLRVGVVADSTGADFAAGALPPDATVVPFTTFDDAIAALQSGTIGAIVADAPVNGHQAGIDDSLVVTETQPTNVRYGLAVDPTDPTLLADVDRALDQLATDGTLSRLSSTWFGG